MKTFKQFLRILSAGMVSFLLLSFFCHFYTRWPVHIPNDAGNTDYIWQPGARWMLMTEGISWGKIDDEGYNNLQVIEDPNVLILGSSHMEAKNVPQTRNTAYLLQEQLGPDFRVYNKGISGHFFAKVCQYLRENLELYETAPKYVIIETDSLAVSQEDVNNIFNHTVEFTPSYTEGLIAQMQKNAFIRHAFHCISTGWAELLFPPRQTGRIPSSPSAGSEDSPDRTPYDQLFAYIDKLQKEFHTQVIIFHHPKEACLRDGSTILQIPREQALFAEVCAQNHVIFLDMEEAFLNLMHNEYKLPHGFITGTPGSGHLNQDGHRAIAEELAQVILTLEEEAEPCR